MGSVTSYGSETWCWDWWALTVAGQGSWHGEWVWAQISQPLALPHVQQPTARYTLTLKKRPHLDVCSSAYTHNTHTHTLPLISWVSGRMSHIHSQEGMERLIWFHKRTEWRRPGWHWGSVTMLICTEQPWTSIWSCLAKLTCAQIKCVCVCVHGCINTVCRCAGEYVHKQVKL